CNDCIIDVINKRIPLFSIPNYCFPESVPDCLKDFTLAETLMISKVYPRTVIYQHRLSTKGGHSFLKGHCVSYENNVGNAVTILPRTNAQLDELLRVVFVGSSYSLPNLPRVNELNRVKVIDGLLWLKENNSNYRNVTI
ncbi:hypothetical protein BC833DRAFT_509952, partial [Globomyces pollinis-pini]